MLWRTCSSRSSPNVSRKPSSAPASSPPRQAIGRLSASGCLRLADQSARPLRQVVCRRRDRSVLMPPEQIFWFQVEDGIVKAHTGSRDLLGELSACRAGDRAPSDLFFRARREVLVNLNKIKEIQPYVKSGFLLVMADSAATRIVVSERQARSLRQRIPGLQAVRPF